jgi:hypothetical protein
MSITYFLSDFLYQMTISVFLKRLCKPSQKMGVSSAPGPMESTLSVHNTSLDLSYGHGPSGPPGQREDLKGVIIPPPLKKINSSFIL